MRPLLIALLLAASTAPAMAACVYQDAAGNRITFDWDGKGTVRYVPKGHPAETCRWGLRGKADVRAVITCPGGFEQSFFFSASRLGRTDKGLLVLIESRDVFYEVCGKGE